MITTTVKKRNVIIITIRTGNLLAFLAGEIRGSDGSDGEKVFITTQTIFIEGAKKNINCSILVVQCAYFQDCLFLLSIYYCIQGNPKVTDMRQGIPSNYKELSHHIF
jgi:hypothetical protein